MINVVPFSQALQEDVIDLILTIQQVKFGFKIRAEDQPDLLDVEGFFQTGVGGFWVAIAGDRPVGTIGLRDIGEKQGALRKMFVEAAYRGREFPEWRSIRDFTGWGSLRMTPKRIVRVSAMLNR